MKLLQKHGPFRQNVTFTCICKKLIELDLSETKITNDQLAPILAKIPNLISLDISGCANLQNPKIPCLSLIHLGETQRTIAFFDFIPEHLLLHIARFAISKNAQTLKSFALTCKRFHQATQNPSLDFSLKITPLMLTGISTTKDKREKALLFLNNHPGISEIDASHTAITDLQLTTILCKKITQAACPSLSRCKKITQATCPSLTRLNLAWCKKLYKPTIICTPALEAILVKDYPGIRFNFIH